LSKKEKILILATFLAMVVIMLVIIVGITKTALPLERVKNITGTVHYINEEGGFWGIVGDDGKRYEPMRLPSELKRPGLKTEFTLIFLKDHISIRAWGIPVEILDYRIIH